MRLYIQPTPGNGKGFLGRIAARLHYMGYTPTIIGWGFPPIYVNAPRSVHATIMQQVKEIDPDTIFAYFRPDVDGLEGLRLDPDGQIERVGSPPPFISGPVISTAA